MGYVEEQYELYKEDPEAVDSSLKSMFEKYGAPVWTGQTGEVQEPLNGNGFSKEDVRKITAAMKCIDAIRRFGHLEADIYAVGGRDEKTELLNPNTYGISEEDLKEIPASWLVEDAPSH